ncbi:hypothetical protein GS429_13980 [Natronorubrum sp. JWXQ-INN-674]|uniref:Uncharacterized protein n=1 Tax=Natronorubrum halalkaliphilum TaxID=2691917 RepID=A0A6B0VPZ6_9EURY|nr:hypothetical protein [Natronorubrum halalkaliphilum]MXV63157.1 hypothetical protein [Natronorubrum halalkaliphilum]
MQNDGTERRPTFDEPEDVLERLFRSGRTNALISWVLVGILCLVFLESVLDADTLWIVFVAATAAIVLAPPVAYWDWRMMLPWELLVVALLPILVRALFGGELGTFGYYLSVAGLALLLTVEFHMFTVSNLRLNHAAAVTSVVLTTMASAAAWAIVRWNMDRQLGTSFLIEPGVSQDAANEALMIEFLWVTLAGLAAGVLFDAYFRRRGRRLRHRLWQVVRR